MPLSEHEQRLFEQIERSLAEDPKFASAVRASDPRFHTRRRFVLAGVILVVGLAVLVYGAVSKVTFVGVLGFVLMLGALAFAITALSRSQGRELHAVGGNARRRTGSPTRRNSFIDRLEYRWRQRPEGHR